MKIGSEEFNKAITDAVGPVIEKQTEDFNKKVEDIDKGLDEKVVSKVEFVMDEADKKAGDPKGMYNNLGEFALDVYKAGKMGTRTEKLQNLVRRDIARQKGVDIKTVGTPSMNESSGIQGAYLIPTEFSNQLLKVALEQNDLLGRCTMVPVGTNNVEIPYVDGFDESGGTVWGGIRWYWIEELEGKTATKPKLGKIKFNLNELAGMAYVSDQLLEDSPQSIESILTEGFKYGFNYTMEDVIINGTGAGQPEGYLNSNALTTQAIETGQTLASDAVMQQNVIKMYSRIWRKNAALVWVIHPDLLPALSKINVPVGTGGTAVFMPTGGMSVLPYDMLLGKPIIWSDAAQAIGTTGDIVLCDFSQYMVAQKGAIKFATSIHLKFDFDQTAFRFTYRVDGQCWWPSELTPRRGNTRSPFVALGTRT